MNNNKALNVAIWVLAVFLVVMAIGGVKKWNDPNPIMNVVSINGKGEALAIPDVATFTFGSEQTSKTVAEAQKIVTEKMNLAIQYLKDQNIEEKDIQTINYSIYPKYDYTSSICTVSYCPPQKQVLSGYTVSQNVSVKVREIAKAGDILGELGKMGISNISGLNFTVDNDEAIKTEARGKAIENAKEKAESLAKSLGVRLVRITGFYEDNGVYPMYAEAYGKGGDSAVMRPTSSPVIPQGEVKATSNVVITYEIR